MKKTLINHLTVNGFVKENELTNLERLAKQLDEAKIKLKNTKLEVAEAKQKLDLALEESLKKIENDKKLLYATIEKEETEATQSSTFSMDNIKAKYESTIADLEIKKNEIMKKIDEYKADGSVKWDSFKHNLTSDMEELGKALKGFTKHSK